MARPDQYRRFRATRSRVIEANNLLDPDFDDSAWAWPITGECLDRAPTNLAICFASDCFPTSSGAGD